MHPQPVQQRSVVTSHAYFQIVEIQVNVAHRLGFPRGIYSEIHSPIITQEIPCVMALTLQPIRDFPLPQVPGKREHNYECFQTIRKRDFEEILENFLTAGHIVFFKTPPNPQV